MQELYQPHVSAMSGKFTHFIRLARCFMAQLRKPENVSSVTLDCLTQLIQWLSLPGMSYGLRDVLRVDHDRSGHDVFGDSKVAVLISNGSISI